MYSLAKFVVYFNLWIDKKYDSLRINDVVHGLKDESSYVVNSLTIYFSNVPYFPIRNIRKTILDRFSIACVINHPSIITFSVKRAKYRITYMSLSIGYVSSVILLNWNTSLFSCLFDNLVLNRVFSDVGYENRVVMKYYL